MRKSFRFNIVIVVLLLPFYLYSQNGHRLDSLKRVINDKTLHDTVRARAVLRYMEIMNHYSDSNTNALVWADSLSRKYNNENLTASLINEKLNIYKGCGDSCMARLFKEATAFVFYCRLHHDTLFEAKAYATRASSFWNYGIADKAIQEQTKAANLYLRTNELQGKMYNIYLVGYYMFNNRQFKEALPYFMKAYKMSLQYKIKSMQAEASGWIGTTYSALRKFDSAIYYRHISFDYCKGDKMGTANSYRYLGDTYENMGKLDSAVAVYKRSINLFEEVGNNPLFEKFLLSTAYYKQGRYELAAKIIDELLDTTKSYNNPLVTYYAARLAGDVYDKACEPVKSIWAFRKFIRLNDSIQKSDKTESVTEMNAKLEFEQAEQLQKMEEKHREDLALKDMQREAIIRNVLIAGLVAILLFAAVIYRYFLQKKKDNILLAKQKNEIEYQKKEIDDSINYAHRIQATILSKDEEIKESFMNFFILYRPKNVVSGDFYWYARMSGRSFIAAVDCTGHGVPGAFMSMISNDKLNLVVKKDRVMQPAKILSALNLLIKDALHQNMNTGVTLRDGMDMAIISYHGEGDSAEVVYAGANRPLYLLRGGNLEEVKPTKASIGGFTPDDKEFEEHHISLCKGDTIYLCTDGYADQFGGGFSKKFTSKRLKTTLMSIAAEPMHRQKEMLEQQLIQWQGEEEQVDDILIIGIRV